MAFGRFGFRVGLWLWAGARLGPFSAGPIRLALRATFPTGKGSLGDHARSSGMGLPKLFCSGGVWLINISSGGKMWSAFPPKALRSLGEGGWGSWPATGRTDGARERCAESPPVVRRAPGSRSTLAE